ncbi:Peptidase family A1 domain [Arabidopsis thaliana x Arabidopsis arenosa]|uniref:Peptidase family A1 domain n=1 Tax=Arabidopsis thaliana x Arabidopsis arenosa TaxID=1240361 RepID=A0A8T1XGH9_9BRAS|nr:Peptidase family A1 domain [Arabidopsis thaliana x Arabidopsis arenosa]
MENSLVVLCLLFFSAYSYVSAHNYSPKTLVSTVSKNTILPIFTFTLNKNQEFFIHIGGPYLVRKCNDGLPRPIVPCDSPVCALTRGVSPHQCPLPTNTVINGVCACQATAFEPFQRLCNSDQFTYGDLSISSLNPTSPSVTFNNVYYLCIPKPFLVDFPPGVFGLAGLAPTALATWNQLTRPRLGLEKKFALCLPSDESPLNKGAIYFGGGPYKLRNIDARSMLSYTRLIRNPRKLNNYFLGLKGISINGKRILLAPNAFDFDRNGDGGVTLSTVFPFTMLRSDVYKVFIEAFAQATSDIPRVISTTPLEFCLKSTTNLQVPRIDLELAAGVIWKVSAANAMKKVSDDVACLAFVNGGDAAAQAVVIGLHQMENTLVEFDVGRSAFGFSCSLGLVNASCGDFQTRP